VTTVHEALLKVRQQVGAIGKGSRNQHFNFSFRGIEEVLNAVGPALLEAGVHCYPELRSLDSRDVTTGGGKKAREVTVTVAYHYVGPEGDEFVAVVPGESADAGSSAVSKAMSVALRIAHLQALQIPTAMTDPEAGSLERADDPLRKVKADIWEEAEKKGWIIGDGEYTPLADDFAEWSQGENIRDADVDTLQKYLVHLRPNRKMSRQRPAGAS
jgi:hypothetical protein